MKEHIKIKRVKVLVKNVLEVLALVKNQRVKVVNFYPITNVKIVLKVTSVQMGKKIKCEDGKYQDQQGKSTCKTCTVGHMCKNGGKTKCEDGTYQDEKGKSTCKTCPKAKFYCEDGLKKSCPKLL